MRAVDIIRKKRDGHALDPAEIAAMVAGNATGEVADYQWAALLMAIVWRGMDAAETAALDRRHDPFGHGRRPLPHPGPKDRQAQHRRGRRQDVADPGADRRGGRGAGADGLGTRRWGTPAERSTSSSRSPAFASTSTWIGIRRCSPRAAWS